MPTTAAPSRRRVRKFTGAATATILAALRAGNTMEAAAGLAGVHRATVYRWYLEGGRDDAPPHYREFRCDVDRARAVAEVRMVAAVMQAAMGGAVLRRTTRTHPDGTTETTEHFAPPDGRLALAWLERARPAHWSRRRPLNADAPTPLDAEPFEHEGQEDADAAVARIADRLRAFLAERDATDPGPPGGEDQDGDQAAPPGQVLAGEIVHEGPRATARA